MHIFYTISSLITMAASFILGIFVYLKAPKNITNKSWLLMSISVAVWSAGFCTMVSGIFTKETTLFLDRISHIGAIVIPVFYLYFVLALLNKVKEYKKILRVGYFLAVFFLLFVFSKWFIADVVTKQFFKYYPEPGVLYLFFNLMFVLFIIFAQYLIIKNLKFLSGIIKNQVKYVLIASFIGFFGGASTFLLVYDIPIPPIGAPLVFIYTVVITYAILRYRLMDITVAITRTGVFVAVYTLVLGLPFAAAIWLKGWLVGIFGPQWWILPLGLMGLLATTGPFIYIYVERKAEDKLLGEQKRYQETLKQASIGMTRIRDLRKLLDLITHIVTKSVKIEYAAVYLYDAQTNDYILQVSRDKGRIPIPRLKSNNTLISWLTVKREPLIYEEIRHRREETNDVTSKLLEENMRLLNASVIIPSFLEDRFVGFFVLGDKLSGQIYTPEDLNVFQVLASQAALAIENAQFYADAKEMQEKIATAEKMATIGTMANGLSHQINNRFYALALIAGDTIDTIKLTDTSKCAPEIKKMIEDISRALGRIKSNVVQGGQVVEGLLKYSRNDDEGFEAVDLGAVITNTLEMVQYKVKLSEIEIARNFAPNSTPKIKGNMAQLEEVFFNFIDNAYDAIVERRNLLQEDGYHGKITISAAQKDNNLEIIIEDNGLGIKEDNHKKIFTPFFTTKASSRKGTGLGLYVIKRIINDMHQGKIDFQSEYKAGTKFIIQLPLA